MEPRFFEEPFKCVLEVQGVESFNVFGLFFSAGAAFEVEASTYDSPVSGDVKDFDGEGGAFCVLVFLHWYSFLSWWCG